MIATIRKASVILKIDVKIMAGHKTLKKIANDSALSLL